MFHTHRAITRIADLTGRIIPWSSRGNGVTRSTSGGCGAGGNATAYRRSARPRHDSQCARMHISSYALRTDGVVFTVGPRTYVRVLV